MKAQEKTEKPSGVLLKAGPVGFEPKPECVKTHRLCPKGRHAQYFWISCKLMTILRTDSSGTLFLLLHRLGQR